MTNLDAQIDAVRLAWTLDPDDTPALTDTQRSTLQAFMGWGQLAKAFTSEPEEGAWATRAAALEEILPYPAWEAAAGQVDTSFYTPTVVTDAVYAILRSVGFTSGRAFEPGCGAGAFMSATPADMDIRFTGIDIDPTATRIARLLHPTAEIRTGRLEKTPIRNGHFDVAIGNVPFSEITVHDNDGLSGSLHNYFIDRAALAVRPGGYVVMVTSRHTLDAARGLLQRLDQPEGVQFVGAVRLPSGAFAEAGTGVVTDIVILRRLTHDEYAPFWAGPRETVTITDRSASYWYPQTTTTDNGCWVDEPAQAAPGVRTRTSVYWTENPTHVAGRQQVTTYTRSPLVVSSADPAADIRRAVGAVTAGLPALSVGEGVPDLSDVILEDEDGRKERSFHVIDGQMHQVQLGQLVPTRGSKELTALVALRDAMTDLLALEADTALPDTAINDTRARTRGLYEKYVTAFGPLNRGTLVEGKVDEETGLPAMSWRRPAMGGFRKDPDSALVMALEVFDQTTSEARAADILTRRVNRAPARIERVDTPGEALAVTMGESGQVDLVRVADLLGLATEDDARAALTGLVYDDPDNGRVVSASEYLSGDIRRKLALAEHLGHTDNADALRAVLPVDLGPLEIVLSLGHPLVRDDDVEAFIRDGLNAGSVTVRHETHLGTWEVDGGDWGGSMEARQVWGTPDMSPARLVEHALNNKSPEVTERVWDASRGDYRQVRDLDATAAAAMKLDEVAERFQTWVWEDAERSTRICREYNDRYNSYVTRAYTGTGLSIPGMSESFTPWGHQVAAVERIVSTPTALIGHPVGAGKSATAALAAVTLRKFGLANKPLIVVPNHLLEQMAREVQQVIPTAKLLVATKEDLARDSRRLFAARCATGDWDAVIMTHSAFTLIPVHPDVEASWVRDQQYHLRNALSDLDNGTSKGAKAIARRMRSFEAQMDKARGNMGDADAIYFDQLGIDYLMVDEMHLFRRLPTHSTQRGSGLGSGSSKRSTDLLLKIETLRERKGWNAPVIAGFTGTPWSNTLAETWVWQRYLQPDVLDTMDMRSFDAWAGAFVKYETAVEIAPDGSGFRTHRRPVGLVNVAEIKTMLAQVADLLDPATLQTARPDAAYDTVVVTGTDEQMRFVASLAERAENLRTKNDTGIENDNMLVIVGDGRKVALDPRLVGLDDTSPKFTAFAREAAASYRENAERTFGQHTRPGGFQLVFCDLGTPGADDSRSYGRIRRALVAEGVPAHLIRFVHEATTDKARAALFAACRDGEVAILIGSTPKVGMGTNVQTRMTDLWHLDAPWLPSEMIQRDGRGIRHGNLSGTVCIRRVVTEGSFDAYMWAALERKSRSFDALYAAGSSARELEDVSAATLSYGEVKALAAGNPLLLEQAEARTDVKRLRLLRAVHLQSVNAARDAAKHHISTAEQLRRRAGALLEAAEMVDADGPVTVDVTALAQQILSWRQGGRSYQRFPLAGAVGLRAHTSYKNGGEVIVSFGIDLDWKTLAEYSIDPRFAKKSVRRIAEWVAERVERDAVTFEATAHDLVADADRHDDKAAEATALVERSVFDKDPELTAAVERLRRIDAAIDEQAAVDQGLVPAS